ncbi:MAG: DUF6527 family protein [Micromonosporaceae bacterium]
MTGAVHDLGDGHTLRFVAWAPDRALNPQYDGIPDVERWGAIIAHPAGPTPIVPSHLASGQCEGMVTFDGEVQRQLSADRPRWTVESWEPLTLSPSVLCACGDHGFVRDGRWVRA